MKLIIFDRKKYIEAIKTLQKRNAPTYVIEAYKNGYTRVVNQYYLMKVKGKSLNEAYKQLLTHTDIFKEVTDKNLDFLNEAITKRDEDFLKAFYVMTNLDIVTGNKLPPSTGKLLKDRGIYSADIKNIFKKIK